jgi:predicted nucleic acid-binding protein
MVVLDASAIVHVVVRTPTGQELEPLLESAGGLHAPAMVDAEVVSALRGIERSRALRTAHVEAALLDFGRLRLRRHPYRRLFIRAWELRRNFTIYDALYVALAEVFDASLLTTDRRLAGAVRRHTEVELVQV